MLGGSVPKEFILQPHLSTLFVIIIERGEKEEVKEELKAELSVLETKKEEEKEEEGSDTSNEKNDI